MFFDNRPDVFERFWVFPNSNSQIVTLHSRCGNRNKAGMRSALSPIMVQTLLCSDFQLIEGKPMENKKHSKALVRGAAMFERTKLRAGLVLAFSGLAIAPAVVMPQYSNSQRVEITGLSIQTIDTAGQSPIVVITAEQIKSEG